MRKIKKKKKEICERCGREITEDNPSLGYQINPFAKEIYNAEIEEIFCQECYHQAVLDI